jgi:hypothetical protein
VFDRSNYHKDKPEKIENRENNEADKYQEGDEPQCEPDDKTEVKIDDLIGDFSDVFGWIRKKKKKPNCDDSKKSARKDI